jgi:hypothetical protein
MVTAIEDEERTMRVLRTLVVSWLVLGMSTSALAGDLRESLQQAGQQPVEQSDNRSVPRPYLWLGTGMFVAGMAVGLYAFTHNKNGEFPGTDEYNATNRKLGAAGLFTAFGGGMVLFYGKHKAAPSVTLAGGRVSVSKRLSWR